MSAADTPCAICAQSLVFRWTDTHGVGVCCCCGAPYTIYHYDETTKERLEKPPELALNEVGKALAIRYWSERHAMVFPGAYDMGFSSRRSTTYSGASEEDEAAFSAWAKLQPECASTGSAS